MGGNNASSRNSNRNTQSGYQTDILYHQGEITHDNIEPSGNPLRERTDSDTFLRIAYQNIRGITRNEHIPAEIEAMQELGIDIMGMLETNCPWTSQTKEEYDLIMKEVFGTSRTTYSSAPAPTTSTYQPGGTLLTINGHTTGRVAKSGSDPWGHFCWYQLQGRRDEGISIICAYRVCQSTLGVAGPLTAYQQQYSLIRASGVAAPNPRQHVLTDITTLIESH
jgi:hypothetical protein